MIAINNIKLNIMIAINELSIMITINDVKIKIL